MLQIIDGEYQQEPEQRQELHYIELLIEYFVHEIACRNNFEFIQAVLKLFLKVLTEPSLCFSFFFMGRFSFEVLMSKSEGRSDTMHQVLLSASSCIWTSQLLY